MRINPYTLPFRWQLVTDRTAGVRAVRMAHKRANDSRRVQALDNWLSWLRVGFLFRPWMLHQPFPDAPAGVCPIYLPRARTGGRPAVELAHSRIERARLYPRGVDSPFRIRFAPYAPRTASSDRCRELPRGVSLAFVPSPSAMPAALAAPGPVPPAAAPVLKVFQPGHGKPVSGRDPLPPGLTQPEPDSRP